MTDIEIDIRGQIGAFDLAATFQAPTSGITAIFGPSGCGKTSVLRAIAGLNPDLKGRIKIRDHIWQNDSTYLAPHKRAVGYVFQEPSLFPHLTVADNLKYGLKRSQKHGPNPDLKGLCNLLGIFHLLNRNTQNLSGGEKQRIAIARALLSKPDILLMDEPLAALDQANKNEILPYLEKLQATLSLPIFYVSHDLAEVERLADHMVLMDSGKVTASGSLQSLITNPDLPFQKQSDVAVILKGKVAAYDADYDLTTFHIGGVPIVVPGKTSDIGQYKKLRIEASDVGLSLSAAQEGMSYLNSPNVHIQKIKPIDRARVIVQLGFEKGDMAPTLLAAITRKSAEQMELAPGQTVTALIKSISFIEDSKV